MFIHETGRIKYSRETLNYASTVHIKVLIRFKSDLYTALKRLNANDLEMMTTYTQWSYDTQIKYNNLMI